MQRLQEQKRYYKMYKSGRFWVVAGIMVFGAGVSPMIGHADTNDAVTTAQTSVSATSTSTGNTVALKGSANNTAVTTKSSATDETENQSITQVTTTAENTGQKANTTQNAEAVAAKTQSTAATAEQSNQQTSVTQTTAVADKSTATVANLSTEQTAGTTSNTNTEQTVDKAQNTKATQTTKTTSATSTTQTTGTTSNTNAAQTTETTANNTAEQPNQPTESATNSTTTDSNATSTVKQSETTTPTIAAATDVDDEDVSSQFADANLLTAVRSGLGLTAQDKLTVNTIKAYKNADLKVQAVKWNSDGTGDYQPVTSLQGLQLLANLPAGTTTSVTIQIGANYREIPQFDFSPLQSVQLYDLNLYTFYWGAVTDKQLQLLASLDPSQIHNLEFSSPNKYLSNPYGMTNRQFNILVPFVKAAIENSGKASQMIGFSGNQISDFSGLKSLVPTTDGQVTGLFENIYLQNKVSYRPGDTIEVASELTGLQGESLNYTARYYQDDGTANGKLVQADAHLATVTDADGTTHEVWKYTLVNPKVNNGYLIYGTFYYADGIWKRYYTDAAGNPIDYFNIAAGALVYQPVTSSKAQLTFNPSEIVMGPDASWNYLAHIASVTDYDGNAIESSAWGDLSIKNMTPLPDLATAGVQNVTFTYTDNQGNELTATAVVKVVASQASITAKAPQTVWPQEVAKLSVADLVQQVTDATGQVVTDVTNVAMTPIDKTQAGAQAITLTYTDAAGNQVTAITTITVDLAELKTAPVQLVAGPNAQWHYGMSVAGVTDSLGNPVEVDQATINVISAPDLSPELIGQPQNVILAYVDDLGRTQQVSAVVTTTKSQAQLVGRDVTLIAGPVADWTLSDSVDWSKSLMSDGQPLSEADVSEVTADLKPNLQVPGQYALQLSYVDAAGNLITGTATVNVIASQAVLQVKNSQIKVGSVWQAGDNLVQVTNQNGEAVGIDQLTVTKSVDTSVAGVYPVTYTYTDAVGNVLTETAFITVVEDPTDPDDGGGTTDPGDGGGTTDPGDGGGTTDPGDGGGTTEPGDGGGTTDPGDGGGTTDPGDGGGTTDPGDGGGTTDPGNGGGTTDPGTGGGTTDPGEGDGITDPGNGDDTTNPDDNVDTTNPDKQPVIDDGEADVIDKPDLSGNAGSNGDSDNTGSNQARPATQPSQSQQRVSLTSKHQVTPATEAIAKAKIQPAAASAVAGVDHAQAKRQAKLPQTNEAPFEWAALMAGLIGLVGALGFTKRRRHNN
ncbi:bacterial Ig-like domain-containing protein [Lactiplantibacillus pentosus]|uniref:bacterial Ig-like domain-containing protein n=1 Tax=Lactiplantibacillus pentosus TaxID=1589 RepID=UPI0021A749E5|nr:bacterial Ig-like domain-containing protein [Lactiplantibacillus pentosus]MCT3286037.1 LPXTG cell wall anchor domain-containing protein [Lactiplantibacillus pentosus]